MRAVKKEQLLNLVNLMTDANEYILKQSENFEKIDVNEIAQMLCSCQESAVTIGDKVGEESSKTVVFLKEYCDLLYRQLSVIENKSEFIRCANEIKNQLIKICDSINNDLPTEKKEIVFLPYKVSMWDSLESIWKAADEDENCNAVVIPIPYFERTADRRLGEMHYEGLDYPDYVPVTDWKTYNFSNADVIYIHNPYDDSNYVTSVHPFFYSENLKKYTDCLVYVPYYSTTGGMLESQKLCSAYLHADYIVIQSEKYRKFFDERLADEKFLPFGSPKFDRIINTCKNPAENEWKERIKGKKVYFYNTSIGGFLNNANVFLKKMLYVFNTFKDRDDAVILWRPHPLLESTIKSMRPALMDLYNEIKNYFISENIGIFDDTPDITNAVAWSDAYIGDAGTSVTSLFEMSGKPLFILNNFILSEATKEECLNNFANPLFSFYGMANYKILYGNKLFSGSVNDNEVLYKYVCDLPCGSENVYFSVIYEVNNKIYIMPQFSQSILKIENGNLTEIKLEQYGELVQSFGAALYNYNRYIILIPNKYPKIVRFDLETDEVVYLGEMPEEVYADIPGIGDHMCGGVTLLDNVLYMASLVDGSVRTLNILDGTTEIFNSGMGCCGFSYNVYDDNDKDLWLLPFNSTRIARFDTITKKFRYYDINIPNFECRHWSSEYKCDLYPFSNISCFKGDYIYIFPCWGNKFVKLNKKTGKAEEWIPPMEIPDTYKNGYYMSWEKSYALKKMCDDSLDMKGYDCLIYSGYDRKLYKVNVDTDAYEEVKIKFDIDELKKHNPGFSYMTEQLHYVCYEDCFNSLKTFLDGNIVGKQYSVEEQKKYLSSINASLDGTCGEKVHRYVTYNKNGGQYM